MGGRPIGIPFFAAKTAFFQMRRSSARKLGIKRRVFSQFSNLPNNFESWKRKPFMNSLICAKSESFPWSFCTSFKLHVLFVRKKSIMLTIPVAFDAGSFHVIVIESKSIPSTVPFVPMPKDFSRFGQSSAKGSPTWWHTSTYLSAKFRAKSVDAGEITGTSSSCLWTMSRGTLARVHTIFTTVSRTESKFAGADLLPKTVVRS